MQAALPSQCFDLTLATRLIALAPAELSSALLSAGLSWSSSSDLGGKGV